jgi:hypothetical protein
VTLLKLAQFFGLSFRFSVTMESPHSSFSIPQTVTMRSSENEVLGGG